MPVYLSADIARTPTEQLTFPADPRSQRAYAASRVAYDPDNDTVQQDTLFQITFAENVSYSSSIQYDEILAGCDIEGVGADRLRFGRQRVVRNVNVEDDGNPQQAAQEKEKAGTGINNTTSTFKLTLEDAFGNIAYAVELDKLSFLSTKNFGTGFPLQLGCKLLVKKGTEIFRGVMLLEKEKTEFLGGIVPGWNQDIQQKHVTFLKKKLEKPM